MCSGILYWLLLSGGTCMAKSATSCSRLFFKRRSNNWLWFTTHCIKKVFSTEKHFWRRWKTCSSNYTPKQPALKHAIIWHTANQVNCGWLTQCWNTDMDRKIINIPCAASKPAVTSCQKKITFHIVFIFLLSHHICIWGNIWTVCCHKRSACACVVFYCTISLIPAKNIKKNSETSALKVLFLYIKACCVGFNKIISMRLL